MARLLRRRGLALRHLARPVLGRGGGAAAGGAVPALRHPHHLVHPRPLRRDLPRPVPHGGRRRPRDRRARLLAREPHRDDPRAGDRGARQVHRPHREAERSPADRLRRPVVGVQPRDQRAAARARHQVRPQPDEQRLPSVLRPGGGLVDQDRLRQGRPRVDEAVGSGGRRPSSSTSRATGTSTTCRR